MGDDFSIHFSDLAVTQIGLNLRENFPVAMIFAAKVMTKNWPVPYFSESLTH
jgi:hypothetical protein